MQRLVARLQDTESAVTVVHHDARSAAIPVLPTNGRARLMPDPASHAWGGLGLVEITLQCLRWIRDEIPDFSWIVMISGQDYPVVAPRDIEVELWDSKADGFLRWKFVPRIASRRFTEWQRGASHRYYWHTLPGTQRTVPVPRVRTYLDGIQVHAGSVWMNLSRRSVEVILEDPAMLSRLRHRFRSMPAPSEAFFPTLLLNSSTDLRLVCRDRRFYRSENPGRPDHPDLLTLDDFEAIRESDAFFARKIDPLASRELVDRLDQHIQTSLSGSGH